MNVKFHTLNNTYRAPVSSPRKRMPQSTSVKTADYDTVDIKRTRNAQDDEESFSRLLARDRKSVV